MNGKLSLMTLKETNMNKSTFSTIVLKLQLAFKRNDELYKLGVEMSQVTDTYHFIIDELMRSCFNEEQLGWIDWYLYERPSLIERGKYNQAWKTLKDGTKEEICYDIDSLWETVCEAASNDEDYEEICKDEDCPKCKELPKVLRGKVKHKFPILTQSEIISVTKEELFSLTNPK